MHTDPREYRRFDGVTSIPLRKRATLHPAGFPRRSGGDPLMPTSFSDNVLIKKLNALGGLSHEEEEALVRIIGPRRTVNAGADIVEDGSSPAFSTVLLEGFCCRYKLLRQGRRQILAFQIP